jgi:Leucine-rich repeat (LRR) protein
MDCKVLESLLGKSDCCSHKGIVCSGLRVTRIQLQHQRIRGGIPPNIGQLQQLQVLNLEDNFMEGEIPESMSQLTRLQSLVLSKNQFHGFVPPALLQMNLTTFDISNTRLLLNSSHVALDCTLQQTCRNQTSCMNSCSMALSSDASASSVDLPLLLALVILGVVLIVGILFAVMLYYRWKRQKEKEQQLYMYEMNYSFVQAPVPAHTMEPSEPIEPLLEPNETEKKPTTSAIFKITAAELDIEEQHYQYTPKAKGKQDNNNFFSRWKKKLFERE